MFTTLKNKLMSAFRTASEFCKDIYASFSKGAMTSKERHFCEAEFVAGAGEVVIAPEAPGGAYMCVHAAKKMAKAGHDYRVAHKPHLKVVA